MIKCEIAHYEQCLLLPPCFLKLSAITSKCVCKWNGFIKNDIEWPFVMFYLVLSFKGSPCPFHGRTQGAFSSRKSIIAKLMWKHRIHGFHLAACLILVVAHLVQITPSIAVIKFAFEVVKFAFPVFEFAVVFAVVEFEVALVSCKD